MDIQTIAHFFNEFNLHKILADSFKNYGATSSIYTFSINEIDYYLPVIKTKLKENKKINIKFQIQKYLDFKKEI